MPYDFSEEAGGGKKKPRFECKLNHAGEYCIYVNTRPTPMEIGQIYPGFDGWARELALKLERGE